MRLTGSTCSNVPFALQDDPLTAEWLPQAMLPRPSLLGQLAIAAAVKIQLALEAHMAESRALSTALVPAGGCDHTVTTVLGHCDYTAESALQAGA